MYNTSAQPLTANIDKLTYVTTPVIPQAREIRQLHAWAENTVPAESTCQQRGLQSPSFTLWKASSLHFKQVRLLCLTAAAGQRQDRLPHRP